jgi:hypothetical protein
MMSACWPLSRKYSPSVQPVNAELAELLDDLRDGRLLLADGHVDAEDLVLRVVLEDALADDRVDGDRGLAGLPVADDELALPAADRGHRVDGLDAGLEGLVDGLARDDARRLRLDDAALDGLDGAHAVDRVAEGVDDAAHVRGADAGVDDAARPLDHVAFMDVLVGPEDRDADVVLLEVEHHAGHAAGELDQPTDRIAPVSVTETRVS